MQDLTPSFAAIAGLGGICYHQSPSSDQALFPYQGQRPTSRGTMRRTLCWVVAAGSLALMACHDATEPPHIPQGPPTLALSAGDTTLLVDETLALSATAEDGDGQPIPNPSITWRSSAPTVASMDDSGHVTALTFGSATLTATMGEVAVRLTVTVVPQFTQIATGGMHSCGITGRGELYCWGLSSNGALGPATDLLDCSDRYGYYVKCSPVPILSSDLRAVAITAGGEHTCALDATGTAFCWGANYAGQAGTGSEAELLVLAPTPVAGGHQFTEIVAGTAHTCGITASRDAYCWGWDDVGQLGVGDVSAERCYFQPCSRTPRLVAGGHEWAQLSATDRATCGVTTAGELYCWGKDVGGSDGMYCESPDNLVGCTHTPILIASSKSYKASGIGNVHRCEQAVDDTLDCWGANSSGAFGNGTSDTYSSTPVTAAGGASYASFVATRTGNCALTSDGRAQCWGRGAEGQIGNGSLEDALTPADVSGGYHFVSLASSGTSDFVCGIADTGRAYCWGLGGYAQLGDNEYFSRDEPSLVRLAPRPSVIRR